LYYGYFIKDEKVGKLFIYDKHRIRTLYVNVNVIMAALPIPSPLPIGRICFVVLVMRKGLERS